jgi:hypothetical protein
MANQCSGRLSRSLSLFPTQVESVPPMTLSARPVYANRSDESYSIMYLTNSDQRLQDFATDFAARSRCAFDARTPFSLKSRCLVIVQRSTPSLLATGSSNAALPNLFNIQLDFLQLRTLLRWEGTPLKIITIQASLISASPGQRA